jgi:lysophospholipase L1-like esterase
MNDETKTLVRNCIRGVAEVFDTDKGLSFNRLPFWTTSHHQHDALTGKVASHTSGVRLLLSSKATQIKLTYRATLEIGEGDENRPISACSISTNAFEDSVGHQNGDLRVWTSDADSHLVEGEDSLAVFDLQPTSAAREVSIWLPHNCQIELLDLQANDALEPATPPATRWLHYGSSISHCMEATEPLVVWPARVAQDENLDLYSLGLAGSCNLEYFAAKTIADWPADLITLKLGINVVNGATMTERTFTAAVHGLLASIREKQPSARIVVISPIYCEGHETVPGPTWPDANNRAIGTPSNFPEWSKPLALVRIREILQGIVEASTDPNLEYVNGLQLFAKADDEAGLMPDGLHPNAEGYLLMAERFKKLVLLARG